MPIIPQQVLFMMKVARIFRRIKKYGDIEKVQELFKNAPPEVKSKVEAMINIVKDHLDGKIDRDEAISRISQIIGIPVDELKELAETMLEFIEEELKE